MVILILYKVTGLGYWQIQQRDVDCFLRDVECFCEMLSVFLKIYRVLSGAYDLF